MSEVILPTPHVGKTVQWFQHADPKNTPVAALVVQVEAPGRVKVQLFKPNPQPADVFVTGVRHVTDPFHKDMSNATLLNGGWDFMPGDKPKDAFDLHKKDIERKEFERMVEAEANERRIKERQALANA